MTDDSEAPNRPVITTEQVRLFEKAEAQIEGFFEEIGNISKKKPDDAINKFKLGFINQVLETANRLLGEDYRPLLPIWKREPVLIVRREPPEPSAILASPSESQF